MRNMTKNPKFTAAFLKAREALKTARAAQDAANNKLTVEKARYGTQELAAWQQALIEGYRACKVEADARVDAALDEKERVCDPIFAAMEKRFAEVNGRATSFTLDAHAALHAIEGAEKDLKRRGVPLKLRAGCEVWEQSAGPTANAYKYNAAGTSFGLRRDTTGGWELISVERITVAPRQRGRTTLVVTAEAREAMIRQALEGVELRVEPVADLARASA